MTHYTERSGNPSEPPWVSDRTKIKVSIALALSVCITIIASTWAVRGYIENWKGEIAEHFQRVENSQVKIVSDLRDTRESLWSQAQMTAWANQLDRMNRTIRRLETETGLQVPDPGASTRRP